MTLYATPKPPVHQDIERSLREAAAARQQQLDECPPPGDDLVAAAYRAAVVRILGDVRAAQERLANGTYGDCLRCGGRISTALLEANPWTRTCIMCVGR